MLRVIDDPRLTPAERARAKLATLRTAAKMGIGEVDIAIGTVALFDGKLTPIFATLPAVEFLDDVDAVLAMQSGWFIHRASRVMGDNETERTCQVDWVGLDKFEWSVWDNHGSSLASGFERSFHDAAACCDAAASGPVQI